MAKVCYLFIGTGTLQKPQLLSIIRAQMAERLGCEPSSYAWRLYSKGSTLTHGGPTLLTDYVEILAEC